MNYESVFNALDRQLGEHENEIKILNEELSNTKNNCNRQLDMIADLIIMLVETNAYTLTDRLADYIKSTDGKKALREALSDNWSISDIIREA